MEGQMQGGATQGTGWALGEECLFDTVITEAPASDGLHGTRGVGEVPYVPLPAAIANPIYRATGVWLRQLPMNPERVFRILKSAVDT